MKLEKSYPLPWLQEMLCGFPPKNDLLVYPPLHPRLCTFHKNPQLIRRDSKFLSIPLHGTNNVQRRHMFCN